MTTYPQNQDPDRSLPDENLDPGLVGTPAGDPGLAGPERVDPSDPLARRDDVRGTGDQRGMGDKLRDAADELGGKVKEGWGELTDDERLAAEGRRQQQAADRRQGDNLR